MTTQQTQQATRVARVFQDMIPTWEGKIYTKKQAKEAILARISGIWDNPQLVRIGLLSVSEKHDIERIKLATN